TNIFTNSLDSGTALTGTITKLATSVIGGAKGSALVHLTNRSKSIVSGLYSITLLASPSDASLDSTDVKLVTLSHVRLKLKPGKSANLAARFVFPAHLADGTYY